MNVGYVTLQYLGTNENWIAAGRCVNVPQMVAKRLDDLKRHHPKVTCRAVDSLGRLVDLR
jgi:hypothetical protein